MANAKRIPANIQTAVVVVEPEKVILELSREEAATLVNILSKVGGCPDQSPRRFANAVYQALIDSGIPELHYSCKICENDASRLVYRDNTLSSFLSAIQD